MLFTSVHEVIFEDYGQDFARLRIVSYNINSKHSVCS